MATSTKIKKVKTVGIGSISLISVLGVILVVYPFFNEQETLKIQVQEKVSENSVLSTRITSLKKTADQVPQVKAYNDSLSTRFPATSDIPGLISSITTTASSAGLGPSAITGLTTTIPAIIADTASTLPAAGGTPAAPTGPVDNTDTGSAAAAAPVATGGATSGGDLASMNVSITVEGSPEQLAAFVRELSQSEGKRAFLIKSFSIDTAENGASKLSLETETFLYRTLPDPTAATPVAPANPASPANPATPAAGNAG